VYRDDRAILVPEEGEEEFRIERNDFIIALSRNENDMRPDACVIPTRPPAARDEEIAQPAQVRRLLVLGWNEKVFPLLSEYAGYARAVGERFSVTLVSPGIPAELSAPGIGEAVGSGKELIISVARLDYLRAGVYEELDPGSFDAVVVLGDALEGSHIEDADTRVIMTLLLLRSLYKDDGNSATPVLRRQQVVGEILSFANKELAESTGTVRDVIISNDLVSRIIAQVCRDRRIEPVLRDLMDEDGKEIYFKPSSRYAREGEVVTFDQLLLTAMERNEVVLGYSEESGSGGVRQVRLNPSRQHLLRVHDGLCLVVLSETE
jgi:hypothetical protein